VSPAVIIVNPEDSDDAEYIWTDEEE